MVEQFGRLAQVTKQLQQSQQENLHLRQSMEKMMEQANGRRHDDALLRKPKVVEVNGEGAAKQVSTGDIQPRLMRLQVKLQEKDREATHLGELLEVEKDKAVTLETTQAHLQSQRLSGKAENKRLSVQIKNLEQEAAQHKAEMENLRQQLASDREALKQAMTTQKHRAERSEEAAELLSIRLQEMCVCVNVQEKQVAEAISAADAWESRHTQTAQEKMKLEADLSLLSNCVEELKVQLHSMEKRSRADREELLDELHIVTSKNSATEMKNYSLQTQLQEAQEKTCCQDSQRTNIELRQKNKLLMEENLQLQQEVEVSQRKLQQSCIQCNELMDRVIKREKSLECSELRTKLQEAQSDARQQVRGASTASASFPRNLCSTEMQITESREQTAARERYTVDKILDLETKLIQVKSEVSQLKLSKKKVCCFHQPTRLKNTGNRFSVVLTCVCVCVCSLRRSIRTRACCRMCRTN
uniref:Outer dense fiber protein 2 n=1 Tax=Gouania willdenowi TaxID=441366 RepID=A0A8C5DWI9_GOUWI